MCAAIVLTVVRNLPRADSGPPPGVWFKGNTHTHTLNSDGDSTPDDVAKWYRQHGYDFLFITDHEVVTEVDPLNLLYGGRGQFLLLPGEEVTSNSRNLNLFVHVNALNPKKVTHAQFGNTARETLQKDLDAIGATGGLAQINHPNFLWQLSAEDIAATHGARLLEIMNMHPIVNTLGAGHGSPSTEEIWDNVLSRGVAIWGVASDDEHELMESPHGDPSDPGRGALPGRGWIVVRARHLSAEEIMSAIERGDFYASTGVELDDYEAAAKRVTVKIKEDRRFQTKYRTQFIGKSGRVLQDSTADPAIYDVKGDEGYVRARITDSNGHMAWTQPVFVQ
jgi:hypothetical protein